MVILVGKQRGAARGPKSTTVALGLDPEKISPGVTEAMRIYAKANEIMIAMNPYLQVIRPKVVFTTTSSSE